jgi:hypothetical protein
MYEPLGRVVQASGASDGRERLQTRELHVYATCKFIYTRTHPFPRHISIDVSCGLELPKPPYINTYEYMLLKLGECADYATALINAWDIFTTANYVYNRELAGLG